MDSLQDNPTKLFFAVLVRFLSVFLLLGIIFFTTAGTFDYINGWIYLCTIFVTLGTGFPVLFIKDKSLLEKRINTSEKEAKQKGFIIVSGILIIVIYALPGLDYRYSWSNMPLYLVVLGEVLFILGYILNMKAMLVNSYASRVVEIQEKQKVIDKGLYSVVRHPMYMSMIMIYLGTCFILGSYWAIIPCILIFIALGFRAINEENILIEGLDGYREYMKKVKYRILPYIW